MMEIVVAILVLSFLVFVTLVVLGVRAAKRGIERVGSETRRALSDASWKAKAAQPGAVGELARLRKEVRASVDTTRGVLTAGSADDPSLREALSLLDQLHGHARTLDRELDVLMRGEPDRARIDKRLPGLRDRAGRIRTSADALRNAALDRAHRHDSGELDALHEQINIEAQALRHWSAPAAEEPTTLPPEPERRQLFRRRSAGGGRPSGNEG